MIDMAPGKDRKPETTAIEGPQKSWLIVLVYAALTIFLGRIDWTQVAAILERGDGLQLQLSDLGTLIILIVCVVLVFRILVSGRNLLNSLRLEQYGEIGRAVITDKWRKKSSEDEDYWMAFEYGDGYRAKMRLSYRGYRNVVIGDEIMVDYLPGQPQVVRIKRDLPEM